MGQTTKSAIMVARGTPGHHLRNPSAPPVHHLGTTWEPPGHHMDTTWSQPRNNNTNLNTNIDNKTYFYHTKESDFEMIGTVFDPLRQIEIIVKP